MTAGNRKHRQVPPSQYEVERLRARHIASFLFCVMLVVLFGLFLFSR